MAAIASINKILELYSSLKAINCLKKEDEGNQWKEEYVFEEKWKLDVEKTSLRSKTISELIQDFKPISKEIGVIDQILKYRNYLSIL